jgi:hypothetical protein
MTLSLESDSGVPLSLLVAVSATPGIRLAVRPSILGQRRKPPAGAGRNNGRRVVFLLSPGVSGEGLESREGRPALSLDYLH